MKKFECENSIYAFDSYREYLKVVLPKKGVGRGRRGELARYLKCQAAFLSQVLSFKVHISKDMAYRTSRFLGLSPHETEFFLLLHEFEKSSTKELTEYLHDQINLQRKAISCSEELILNGKKDPFASTYYSSWIYAAVHLATSLGSGVSEESLAERLHISKDNLELIKAFLIEAGLVQEDTRIAAISSRRLPLDPASEYLSRYHCNWRLKSLASLDFPSIDDLHYTSILALSFEDLTVIRQMILNFLSQQERISKETRKDRIYAFNLDLFELA